MWAAHLFLVPFTGCGINPARSFGPLVVVSAAQATGFAFTIDYSSAWAQQFAIYWSGPISGALMASLVAKFIFQSDETADLGLGTGQTDVGFLAGERKVQQRAQESRQRRASTLLITRLTGRGRNPSQSIGSEGPDIEAGAAAAASAAAAAAEGAVEPEGEAAPTRTGKQLWASVFGKDAQE